MASCEADNPGAGIFRPVCDTLQNEVGSNSPQKIDDARCLALNRFAPLRHERHSSCASRYTRTKRMQSLTFQPVERAISRSHGAVSPCARQAFAEATAWRAQRAPTDFQQRSAMFLFQR